MKLIIVGSTDILGQELIKQALDSIEITFILAIAGPGTDPELSSHSKLVTSAIPEKNEEWERLIIDANGTHACIWNITPIIEEPRDLFGYPDQRKYLNEIGYGVEWMARRWGANLGNPPPPGVAPLKFIYVSSSHAKKHRSENTEPTKFSVQGNAEERVLRCAEDLGGQVQACIAKPGHIVRHKTGNVFKEMVHAAGSWVRDSLTGRLPRVQVEKVAAALLDKAITGNHPETLFNRDLIKIGEAVLRVPEGAVTGGGQAEEAGEQGGETNKQAGQTVQNV
ncbi:uncharacterized protein EAE98_002833 [Botrytis deweyae]|uniref:NAD(P)-binding domain-containing protein n=1 Tax=Botrytis deweyae TaxID=2478750 RepID=A0ABQ7IUV2_9HELO|nr:uncharacterized protein EAE98_002833 [Botrytis deweyae]KAF7934788.1 hypothetical protein EAE98_002833 [Botrytis deweyae]